MVRLILLVALAMAATWCGTVSAGPLVRVESGAVSGSDERGVNVYRGIPFAAPPVGALRWRPPHPPLHWQDTLSADNYGPACPQPMRADGGGGGKALIQSEDCLQLNIWTPDGALGLPVMVWIHGGAFQYGSAVYPIYDGSGLARRGVVVVTINYRLGPLGYFAHPALTEDADADEALGNYGFMDQIAALEWVKRNIAAFGGDPQLVTVFGQSAGGSSIAYLLASPQARGLFARAIVQSGGGFQQPASLGQMEERGVAMARAAGLTDHASASDLRALPADSVIAAAEPLQGSAYGPFVDGRTITEAPWQAIRDKRAANVPLLVGWNDNEASVLSALSLSGPTREAEEGLGIDDLRHLYGDVSEDEFRRQVIGDRFFGAPAAWMAATRAIDSPTFLYHFTYVAQRRRERVPGASHGSEIPFVFQTWDKLGSIAQFVSEEDRRFANLISSCWVAFAQSGTPECRGGPTWEAYDPARDRLMLFAPETQMSATPHRAQFDLLTARFFGDAR